MKKLAALTLSLFLTTGTVLADTPKDKDADAQPASPAKAAKAPKAAEKGEAALASQIEELRQALQAQQEQLQLLKEELAKRDRQIDEARETAASANAKAAEASSKASEAVTTTATLNSTVADVKASNDAIRTTVANSEAQEKKADEEGPASIRFKGITLTPGGFIAAETVYRNRAASAGINTPFTGIPFPGAGLAHVSEFNGTGRQSRISLLAEGKAGAFKMTGYYEVDWLGTGVTSNNRQSNSYVQRQRQIWGQVALDSGWKFTGGQMWSLATETRKGLDNRTEVLPMTIDPQYSVGFTWARQYGFRVVKDFGKASVGFSVEAPQLTIGGRGFPNNFFVNAPGSGGGLFNFVDTSGYTVNQTPDFIVKAAFDPGIGHYEIFGIISTFRQRIYPCAQASVATPCSNGATAPTTFGAFNNSVTGGGIGANARWLLAQKKVGVGIHFLGGDGVGRYSSAQLSDVTARPDGTLVPIRGGSALGTLEFYPRKSLDIYTNFGDEYAFRTAYVNAAGAGVGYGSPLFNNSGCGTEALPGGVGTPGGTGTCNGDIRNIYEATVGFWQRPYQGTKGRIQWGIQYSYLSKSAWSAAAPPSTVGIGAKAIDNMVFTSFRYYLP